MAAIISGMRRAGLAVPAERRSMPVYTVAAVNNKPDTC